MERDSVLKHASNLYKVEPSEGVATRASRGFHSALSTNLIPSPLHPDAMVVSGLNSWSVKTGRTTKGERLGGSARKFRPWLPSVTRQ